jgi:hypothetical protein
LTAGSDAARSCRRCTFTAALLLLLGCGDSPTVANPECEAITPLRIGEPVEAFLGPDDPTYEGGHIDFYGLRVSAEATLRITLASGSVDPFLYLFDDNAHVIAQAYAPSPSVPGETESAVLYWTMYPGCHLVGASTWSPGATGDYTLEAVETVGPSLERP